MVTAQCQFMVPYLTWFSRQETLGSTDPPYYSVQEKFISGFISVILSSELDVSGIHFIKKFYLHTVDNLNCIMQSLLVGHLDPCKILAFLLGTNPW